MSGLAIEKREYLDYWSTERQHVDQLANRYPGCSCEDAATAEGGHGPVDDTEILRYFVMSRFDQDLAKGKRSWRPAVLSKIFKKGLSVCRLNRATREEVEYTASILHENAVQKDLEHGGVVAVLDFPCSAVRALREEGERLCCVVDTPLDPLPGGGFRRPSHADVVHSGVITDDQQKILMRLKIYNGINAEQNTTPAPDVKDCDLSPFIPNSIKPNSQEGVADG